MDRTINIEQDNRKDNDEVTIYDEVLEEIDLAQKYESKLNSIIKECMKNESYENDFWYINYDKSKNTYSMDLYSEGTCQKFPITYKDIQDYNYKIGMTYWAFDDDRMQEAEELKDSIKIDVDSELADLERENNKLFEKCHIIAYSLSAKLANPNNIFIETIKLNKSYMKKVENGVAKYIKDHSVKVLYKVTVKYKATNQIPVGVLIEAQSLDDEFSVCRFFYNIQKGTKFNYSDGTIVGSKNIFTKVVEKVTSKIKRTRLRFTRYADDTIVLVKSEKAANRVMTSITKFIENKLKLKVNITKTKVCTPWDLKYLGFGFCKMKKWECTPHKESKMKFKRTLKRLTNRSKYYKMQ